MHSPLCIALDSLGPPRSPLGLHTADRARLVLFVYVYCVAHLSMQYMSCRFLCVFFFWVNCVTQACICYIGPDYRHGTRMLLICTALMLHADARCTPIPCAVTGLDGQTCPRVHSGVGRRFMHTNNLAQHWSWFSLWLAVPTSHLRLWHWWRMPGLLDRYAMYLSCTLRCHCNTHCCCCRCDVELLFLFNCLCIFLQTICLYSAHDEYCRYGTQ